MTEWSADSLRLVARSNVQNVCFLSVGGWYALLEVRWLEHDIDIGERLVLIERLKLSGVVGSDVFKFGECEFAGPERLSGFTVQYVVFRGYCWQDDVIPLCAVLYLQQSAG